MYVAHTARIDAISAGRRILEFEYPRRPVTRLSSRGNPFVAMVPHGMPKVHPEIFETVFYLYPDRQAAEEGEAAGGTGFMVSVKSDRLEDVWYDYAVSNRHVVRDGDSVIRINTRDGGVEILEFDPSEWFVHPDGDDIAAIPLNVGEHQKLRSIGEDMFLTRWDVESGDFGVGDEAFMVGRFVLQDGGRTNVPAIGFGNISIPLSMMPAEGGRLQESFGVEMRSMRGYSGSPTFVVQSAYDPRNKRMTLSTPMTKLLGVDWGQITMSADVREKIVQVDSAGLRPGEKIQPYVRLNSGMNGIVPIWKLKELLAVEPLFERRAAVDARIEKSRNPFGATINYT